MDEDNLKNLFLTEKDQLLIVVPLNNIWLLETLFISRFKKSNGWGKTSNYVDNNKRYDVKLKFQNDSNIFSRINRTN